MAKFNADPSSSNSRWREIAASLTAEDGLRSEYTAPDDKIQATDDKQLVAEKFMKKITDIHVEQNTGK